MNKILAWIIWLLCAIIAATSTVFGSIIGFQIITHWNANPLIPTILALSWPATSWLCLYLLCFKRKPQTEVKK